MQDQVIVWDPIYEARLPLGSRLFLLYLLVVAAMSLVRSVRLAGQVWCFTRGSVSKSEIGYEQPDLLAASALCNALPQRFAEGGSGENVGSQMMRKLENEFVAVWEACSAKVQTMKRLVVLTFLLSVLVAACQLRPVLTGFAQKSFGPAALSGGMVEVLTVFEPGILVCAMLYATCGLFDGVLLRRKASWRRFLARIENQSPES
jgi:hypothetical protein